MKPHTTCPELVVNPDLVNQVDLKRFSCLNQEGRGLIQQWFRRAWRRRDSEPENCFEPFIYTWFAFNGWAACITNMERDYRWREALSLIPELFDKFDLLVNDPKSCLFEIARSFYNLWPIFKSSEIRLKGVRYSGSQGRLAAVQQYLDSGIEIFEPKCWKNHEEKNEKTPLDWPHTLAALYRVRCNLFHGEKGVHIEVDREIVYRAFQVLLNFIYEAEILEIRFR